MYIPEAWDSPHTNYSSCYDWFCSLIAEYLPHLATKPSLLLENTNSINLTDYDAIYIGGGNTYKLLNFLVSNNLGEKLHKFLQLKKLIYGGSAGAIVFGKTIRTVIEEKENYPEHEGLGFLDFSLRCHYTPSNYDMLKDIAQKLKHTIYALPEDGGLILDGECKIIEKVGDVVVFGDNI